MADQGANAWEKCRGRNQHMPEENKFKKVPSILYYMIPYLSTILLSDTVQVLIPG